MSEHRAIGIDIQDADVVADLFDPAGREAMISEVEKLSGGTLDGVLAVAGLSNNDGPRRR